MNAWNAINHRPGVFVLGNNPGLRFDGRHGCWVFASWPGDPKSFLLGLGVGLGLGFTLLVCTAHGNGKGKAHFVCTHVEAGRREDLRRLGRREAKRTERVCRRA